MGYMSHWVGVSKGLCEINWKNVTHLVQAPPLPPRSNREISLKKGLGSFSDALALSAWKLFVKRLVQGKIRSGELADDQLAKLAVQTNCKTSLLSANIFNRKRLLRC